MAPGDQEWDYYAGDDIRSSPTVVNNKVFFSAHESDDDGEVYALDSSDGSFYWDFPLEYQRYATEFSSPTVVDGTLYIGSESDILYAIDASDGSEEWRFYTKYGIRSSPTVADGTVYVGSEDSGVYAVDASDGSEEWRYDTGSRDVNSSPTIANGTVYVGSNDHNLYALNASDGSEEWVFTTGEDVESSPTVADGTVYVGSEDYNLYALNASDGSEEWSFTTGDRVESSPTVLDGTVYVGSDDDKVYAIDASDGSEEWSFTTGSYVHSSPTIAGDTVYVGSDNLYALDATDGSERWNSSLGLYSTFSSPTVADGTVYIGSDSKAMYAFEASGTGAYSEGSRNQHGTLGHNKNFDPSGSLSGGGSTSLKDSGFIFESGDAISIGKHGNHSYMFAQDASVYDAGGSSYVFESGTGLGESGPFTESFEHQNLSEYYVGDLSYYEINDASGIGGAIDGTYALYSGEVDGAAIFNEDQTFGDTATIEHWHYNTDSFPGAPMCIYAQNSNSRRDDPQYTGYTYGYHSQEFMIKKNDSNDNITNLYQSGNDSRLEDAWIKYTIDRNGSDWTAKAEEADGNTLYSTSFTDNEWSSGYYGFDVYGFSAPDDMWWDDVVIE